MKARLVAQIAVDLAQDTAKPWAILRLGTFKGSQGPEINVTEARLEEMAASYDPNVERAAINFDHQNDGPAHGSLRDPFVKAGVLYAYPTDLSADAKQQITERRRFRQSAEIELKHSTTGGWYLAGLALLGAQRAAVKGLPEVTLADGDSDDLVLEEDPTDPGATAPSTAPNGAPKENTMDPKTTPTAAGETPEAANLAAQTAQLTADREAIATDRAKLTAELAVARRERAEARAAKDVAALGNRVTPGMLKAGLLGALVFLAAAEEPTTVALSAEGSLAADGKATPLYDVLIASLKAAPAFSALGAPEMANADTGALANDKRTAAQRAVDLAAGLKDEEAVRLQQKYPSMFATEAN